MEKFKNKYRITSTRLQTWDYGWAAAYFITINTKNRKHFFGKITNGEMQLSEIGKMVETEWLKTFELRTDMNLYRGEFVVMPDHFHAIIGIGKNEYNKSAKHGGSTDPGGSIDPPKNQFGPQSKNLASVVRGFKSAVTVSARKLNPNFQWQSSFHDRIVRDAKAFESINNYIFNNPANW